jgi:SAM-dependent methyltransferase
MIVTEHATRENFSASGYLQANADVAEAARNGVTDPWHHFVEFGENEGRMQIAATFLAGRSTYGHAKYERFKDCVLTAERPSTSFHFLEESEAFTVALSERHLSASEYAAESANNGYGPFIDEVRMNPSKAYLDVGCGLRNEVFDNCLYVEVYPSLTADVIVAPDCRYPLASAAFDGIGCFAVLEHVTKPWVVASEIHRMLKPGGRCYIAWPFLQPIHGFPSHYFNATRQGLELLFSERFEIEVCRTEPWEGPNHTMNWVLGKFADRLPPQKRERLLRMSVAELIAQVPASPFWTELLSDLPDAVISEFACGNSLIATKK